MDEVGVDYSVIHSTPCWVDPYSRVASNEEVLRLSEESDGRLIPFCCVDPRNSRAVERFLELMDMGFVGLGEFKVPLRVDDPRVIRLLEIADDLGVPLLFHMEDDMYFYDIYALDNILGRFRRIRFIAHGPGWWKHISGIVDDEPYPSGSIVKEGMVQRILRRYDNIFADISAISGLNALSRDPIYARRFLVEFSDRILFGTDFPCLNNDGGQLGTDRAHLDFLRSLNLPQSVLENILYLNAKRLLNI